MRIAWGRLRRRTDRNQQAAGVEVDERVARAGEQLRERQERQREVSRELGARGMPPQGLDVHGISGGGGWGG